MAQELKDSWTSISPLHLKGCLIIKPNPALNVYLHRIPFIKGLEERIGVAFPKDLTTKEVTYITINLLIVINTLFPSAMNFYKNWLFNSTSIVPHLEQLQDY